ncbi:Quinonprotein alcohol dehydrogenase-like superfamily [Plasmopara halstedii]|uniref:Quinonprotein alcohol dehydrogenase-like superfamily n=1 Tax=Plasmopara halstedii TaxID=4781 RepID=A0A0P1B2A3_PLAHL|nr:Quinonprotein alcohol dehydrogenase-like superfamily [Plasmopara halstedii]CEG47996.1 Quinonprotein alcohol dehydrogenase-like superfamily [Plasmopara halstedii]|eukprot:XP_024584365.1 Quinonprotein alcohol dehydrogenase-like superfamily [Plasmopara halstedii]
MHRQLELAPTYVVQLDGKILVNAYAVGDVDGDGATELLFGTLMGKVSIFKIIGDRLSLWRSCEVNGSVTSMSLDNSFAEDIRIVVATAEGKCFVFRSVAGVKVLQLCSEFVRNMYIDKSGIVMGDVINVMLLFKNAALNVCDVVHVNKEVIVATRDGRVFIYSDHANFDELAEYTQIAKLEINGEIEALIVLPATSDTPTRVLARCFSGAVFSIAGPNNEGVRNVGPWNGPKADNDSVTFVVNDIELGGKRGMNALVSLNGLVSLFSSSGQKLWEIQLSEPVVNADKLEMSATSGERHDAIVVCTWSGQMYAIQSEKRLVQFRMLLPGCSMFCANIQDSSGHIDPTIVSISTSGTVFVYRDVQNTLVQGFEDSTLADQVKESAVFAQIDTPVKRIEVMNKLHKTFPHLQLANSSDAPGVNELIKIMLAVQL